MLISLVAVGRWQKNKDLSWYAKGDDSQEAQDAAKARADEIRRIKEAEQDALSAALGFPVEPRMREGLLPAPGHEEKVTAQTPKNQSHPIRIDRDERDSYVNGSVKKEKMKRNRSRDRHRDGSRDRDRARRHREHDNGYERSHRRHRSRSRDGRRRRRSRSTSYTRRREGPRSNEKSSRKRSRSRSYERLRDNGHNHGDHRRRSQSPDRRRRKDYREERYAGRP